MKNLKNSLYHPLCFIYRMPSTWSPDTQLSNKLSHSKNHWTTHLKFSKKFYLKHQNPRHLLLNLRRPRVRFNCGTFQCLADLQVCIDDDTIGENIQRDHNDEIRHRLCRSQDCHRIRWRVLSPFGVLLQLSGEFDWVRGGTDRLERGLRLWREGLPRSWTSW
jgi:hypothetical protein